MVPGTPYTIGHFEEWAKQLILDTGDEWPIRKWQLDIVQDILNGIHEVWVVIPQGNAKTTLMAAVALYHIDNVPSPWVPIGASSREQAEIMFGQCKVFIENTPGMDERFRVYDGYRKIILRDTTDPKVLKHAAVALGPARPATGRGIKVYAADEKTGDGVIPTLAFVDEGHRHKNLGLYRTWRGKTRKRTISKTWDGPITPRKATIVMMSTAGEPGADFEQTRENLRNTATNRQRVGSAYLRAEGPGHVIHEYAVPSPKEAHDLAIVKEANPLMTITHEDLVDQLNSPSLDYGEDWLRLTCNIPARSSKAAVSEIDWDNAYTDEEIPPDEPVYVGLDVAWVLDTTAVVPLWMKNLNHRVLGPTTILEPPGNGVMLDVEEVHDALQRVHDRNPIKMLVMDMTKAQETAQWAETELGCMVVDRTQNNLHATEDYEAFTEAIRMRWLKHTGDTGLRKHVMHAIARKLPSDKYRFDRPAPSRAQAFQDNRVVDALSAAGMVHFTAVADFGHEPPAPMIAVYAR